MTYTPSPAVCAVGVDPTRDIASDERVEHVRQVDGAVDERSPLQGGNIGNQETIHCHSQKMPPLCVDVQKVMPVLPRV